MAFMDQMRKAQLARSIKAVLRNYSLKGSLRVDNNTTLTLTIQSGSLDFIGNAVEVLHQEATTLPSYVARVPLKSSADIQKSQSMNVNTYHPYITSSGKCLDAINDLIAAMNVGNHYNYDIQADYVDVGWHTRLTIGRLGKPYKYTGTP